MFKSFKIIGIALTLLALAPTGCFLIAKLQATPSAIVGYAPNEFIEKTDEPFFYSIGNELRFNDHIEPKDKVLFNRSLNFVIPSPDSKWALVLSENILWIVCNDSSAPLRVTDVDNLRMGRPAGKKFFRYTETQWAEDSSGFYLIKDETYNSKGSQLFSIHGELTKYNIATSQMQKVFAPFRAFRYFMAKDIGVFFGEANDKGDVSLTVGQGDTSAAVTDISPKSFHTKDKTILFSAIPFYSFSLSEYADEILRAKGVDFSIEDKNPRIGHLSINGQNIISVSEGKGVNRPYFGLESTHSGFLPGDRYFMLNLRTGNISGQLLFDLKTGQYKPLPKDTRVYRNINTHNFAGWTITKDGIKVNLTREKLNAHWW